MAAADLPLNSYGAGASAQTVGARHICMNVPPMPSGARAKVHYHERIETVWLLGSRFIESNRAAFGKPSRGGAAVHNIY